MYYIVCIGQSIRLNPMHEKKTRTGLFLDGIQIHSFKHVPQSQHYNGQIQSQRVKPNE